MQESVVSEGHTTLADDSLPDDSDTVRRFKGSLNLSKAPATSFRSYNIEVTVSLRFQHYRLEDSPPDRMPQYHVACRLVNASSPIDGAMQVPVTIVNIPPLAPQDDRQGRAASLHSVQTDGEDLPPSYFEVVERNTQR